MSFSELALKGGTTFFEPTFLFDDALLLHPELFQLRLTFLDPLLSIQM